MYFVTLHVFDSLLMFSFFLGSRCLCSQQNYMGLNFGLYRAMKILAWELQSWPNFFIVISSSFFIHYFCTLKSEFHYNQRTVHNRKAAMEKNCEDTYFICKIKTIKTGLFTVLERLEESLMISLFWIDHFHNDVNSFEILPWTSLASISCESKSHKRALLWATHEIVLYVSLQHSDVM